MTVWVKPSGIKIELNDAKATIEKAKSLGWKQEGSESGDKFDAMDKDQLEAYAKENHEIDLDKRKSEENLRKQVRELENGNGG